jgi:molybdate transport system regulatory protein
MPPPEPRNADPLQLDGELWLHVHGQALGGASRIGLLRAVAQTGSITQGAKAVGMSYKAAWDAIDTMNNLAGEPLVARSTGGRGGGSTTLTARGAKLVERYAQIDALHRRFVALLNDGAIDLDRDLSLLKTLTMKTSARNQFVGTVSALHAGAVNDEVELTLPGGARIVAVVTRESTEQLGLHVGATAIALIKSSWVMLATGLATGLATDPDGLKLSARNQLPGTVATLTPGAVNAEVLLDLDGGGTLAAIVTQGSVEALGLAVGVRAMAFFKASSVILAVAA